MAPHEVDLQLGYAIGRYRDLGELAESRRDAVDDVASRDRPLDDGTRAESATDCPSARSAR